MQLYEHAPLVHPDSIRVLSLQPGRSGEPLRCHLVVVRLSEDPEFTALSYCWGEPILDILLECNGQPFDITRSLATALAVLRSATEVLALWVDQVCINQSDPSERNAQVLLMGQIYSKASIVRLWLGKEREGLLPRPQHNQMTERFLAWIGQEKESDVDSLRLQILVERLARAQAIRDGNGDVRNKHQLQQVGLKEYDLPGMDDAGYTAVLRLLHRRYFSRGWILQEIALARKCIVHVGVAAFDYMDFVRALACCQSLGFGDNIAIDGGMRFLSIFAMRMACSKDQREDLLTLLLRTRSTETTNPKDKVYCLLGLAGDIDNLGIQPSYAEEESVENVYRDFALRNIRIHGHLDVLSTPQPAGLTPLPSWAPDWRLPSPTMMMSLTGRDQHRIAGRLNPYHATGGSKAFVITLQNPNIIGLSGLFIDTIEECGQIDQSPEITEGFVGAFRFAVGLRLKYLNWKYVALLHTWRPYPNGKPREEAFWRTLIAGHPLDPQPSWVAIRNQYRAWSRNFFSYAILRAWLPDILLVPLLYLRVILSGLRTVFALCCFLPCYNRNHKSEAFQALLTCLSKRVIIRTGKGYIGLAPENTQTGDMIVLLEGGKLPFILRQTGSHWSIVGDSYIYGIMDGEAYAAEMCSTMWIK